jgi:hypothetical protein
MHIYDSTLLHSSSSAEGRIEYGYTSIPLLYPHATLPADLYLTKKQHLLCVHTYPEAAPLHQNESVVS